MMGAGRPARAVPHALVALVHLLTLLPLPSVALTIVADSRRDAPANTTKVALQREAAAAPRSSTAPDQAFADSVRWPMILEQVPSLADAALPHGQHHASARQSSLSLDPDASARLQGEVAERTGWSAIGTLIATLAVGLTALVLGNRLGPFVPKAAVPYIVCVVYIFFSCAIDISIAVQKKPGYAFNPVCAVLVTEAIKLCLSAAVYAASLWGSARRLIPAELSLSDLWCMAVPAGIYSVNNILVYHAIKQNEMSDFGIFRDTMILWTAGLWRFVFKVPLGWARLSGIGVVFAGLVLNKVASTLTSGAYSWRFMWVVAMTLCNAAGGVANEYALKRNSGLDINVQNITLYSFCSIFTAVILLVTDPARLSGSLVLGFSRSTWLTIGLQAIVGLLISRLLKYADAIMKSVATCLRGPLVVLSAPSFTHVPVTAVSCVSAAIVASGCFTYLTQGPMSNAATTAARK